MAEFIRGTDNGNTPLVHSNNLHKQYLLRSIFHEMTGKKDSGKPIIITHDLGKSAGDTVRFHFIPQFVGEGIEGQNVSIIGNENTLEEFYMDIKMDQIAQAFAKKGKMTDKRVIFNFRGEVSSQLRNWFRIMHERKVVDALCGFIENGFDYIKDIQNGRTVYGEGRLILSNGNSFDLDDGTKSSTANLLGEVSPSDKINNELINTLQAVALNGNSKYPIAPIRMSNGEEYYVLIVHPNVAANIRSLSDWKQRALSIIQAGISPEKDPIATGAVGVWNKIIIKEGHYIKTHKDANGKMIARNLLLGANACGLMYGQTLDYSEELIDHKRRISCSADEISGRKKITFDGVDMGVAQVVTAANLK